MNSAKILAIIFTIILVANIILFAMHMISIYIFWIIIILAAVVAWFGIPNINKK